MLKMRLYFFINRTLLFETYSLIFFITGRISLSNKFVDILHIYLCFLYEEYPNHSNRLIMDLETIQKVI